MAFGAYQSTSSQTIGDEARKLTPPTRTGKITVVVEGKDYYPLQIEKKAGYGTFANYDSHTRNLDVLKVYHPSGDKSHLLIYPGHRFWEVGDTLKLRIKSHVDRYYETANLWTDQELTNCLDESGVFPLNPSKTQGEFTGVIIEVKDVIPPKKD